MSVTATEPTLGHLYNTPVLFFPVPTPWPASAGCDKYIHRQLGGGSILAWDPVYPSLGTGAESCYLPQQSSWWFQDNSAIPSTALGPTFVCPEAYSAVHSTVLDGNSAVQTQYTYCCPPKFALKAILSQNERSVLQCTSTAGPGVTISYLSVTFLTSTVTVTGADGSPTRQTNTRSTNLPTSTVVGSSAATVYGVPVNGYNLVRLQTSSTSTTPPPPPGTSDVSTQSSGLAPGAIAGVVIGAVSGLGLLALCAFFFRRRRQRSAVDGPELAAGGEGARNFYSSPRYVAVPEMPVKHHVHELSHGEDAHELPHAEYTHELPHAKYTHELPS